MPDLLVVVFHQNAADVHGNLLYLPAIQHPLSDNDKVTATCAFHVLAIKLPRRGAGPTLLDDSLS